MSLSSVCTQVAEGVLLFTELHRDHVSKAAAKKLKPELCLGLRQLTSDREKECQIQILANGLGAYYLDGDIFLKTLWEHVQPLRRVLLASGAATDTEASLKLICRRIGDPSSAVCYGASCMNTHATDTSQLAVRESVVPRPQNLPVAGGLLVTFMVPVHEESFLSEVSKLSAQLRLLHLASPEIHLSLRLEIDQDVVCDVQYEREGHRHILNTPFKLITALQHFMDQRSIPARQSKLYLVRGNTCIIPSFPLSSGDPLSLKLYSSVAVVPHLPLRKGRKIPANRLCNRLHVSIFGPGSLPLLSAGSQANFSSANLAEWDSYGLSMGQPIPAQYHQPCTVDPHPLLRSLAYEVSDGRLPVAEARRQSAVEANRSLEVFIFLEETSAEGDKRSNSNGHWKHVFCLVHELRRSFDRLVMTHSKKFHQTIHSAMNRLICNYGSHSKTVSVMGAAIPLISEAVASILLHSCSERFKTTCMAAMEIRNGTEMENAVSQQLWRLAKEKQQVSHPSAAEGMTQAPNEPTSPEIIQAVNEADKARETKPRKRSNTGERPPEKTEDDTRTPNETGITEHSDTEMTQEADITHSDIQSCPSPSSLVPETDTVWNQSLFQARLETNRRLHCSEARSTEDCTEDCTDDYFDSLSTMIDDDLTQLKGSPLTDSDNPVVTASIVSPVAQILEESHSPLLGAQLLSPQPLGSTQASITPTTVQGESSHCFVDNTDRNLMDADVNFFEDLEDVVMEDEASLTLLAPASDRVNSKGALQLYTDTTSVRVTNTTSVLENETCVNDHCSDSDTECSHFSSSSGSLLEPLECNTATACKEGLQTDHLGDISTDTHMHTAVPDLTSDTNSCASDSEWNELDCGCSPMTSPMTELYRQTLQSPTLHVGAISDSHNPKDAFDCLKEVEFLEDKSNGLNPVATRPRAECDEDLRVDDSLTLPWSDQDLSWEDSEDRTAASTLSAIQSHKHHASIATYMSPKQSGSFTGDCCVPDIAEQTTDWEVLEEDFEWD